MFFTFVRYFEHFECYIMYYANVTLILDFTHFNNVIAKHWNIWFIARGGWIGFCCFLTDIFQITFKHLWNIVIPCFPFVKFPWEKDNMLREDEDDRMLLLYDNCLYIFSNVNGIEKPDICWKNFYLRSIQEQKALVAIKV